MKILFFIDCLTAGGKERRLVELIKNLKQNSEIDCEVAVMSTDIHYQEIFDFVPVHYVLRKSKKDVSVFYNLYLICKKFKPDIIHCWDSMTAIYSIPTCKFCGIKLINGMVADAPVNWGTFNKIKLRSRISFIFSDLILGNSQAGLTSYQAPANKSVCIHNGFNFNRLTKLEKREEVIKKLQISTKYIIGMVATFSNAKDYKTYFTAAQIILKKRKDVTFLALGKETDSQSSYRYIDPSLLEHFRLLGTQSNIESFINIFDIGVLSTFTEGISNAILEYMALGKPVIATSGGGTNEILLNGKTGFLVAPSNPEELVEQIDMLLTNGDLRFKMGEAGKRRIESQFSINRMVGQYTLACQSLLSL